MTRRRIVGKRQGSNVVRTLDRTADSISDSYSNSKLTRQRKKIRHLLISDTQAKQNVLCFRNVTTTPDILFYKYTFNTICKFVHFTFKMCVCWLKVEYLSAFLFLLNQKSLWIEFECGQTIPNKQKHTPTFAHKILQKRAAHYGQREVMRHKPVINRETI